MVKLLVTPLYNENLYSLLVKKELELRKKNKGTFRRSGKKKSQEDRWFHTSKEGWVRFQRSLGEVLIVLVQTKNPEKEWDLLTSFIGFLYRHFRENIRTITLDLEEIN